MKFMRKLTALILLGLILSSLAGGQVPNVPTAPPNKVNEPMTTDSVPAGVHELTAADVEAFLDGIVPLQPEQQDVAGATSPSSKTGLQVSKPLVDGLPEENQQ